VENASRPPAEPPIPTTGNDSLLSDFLSADEEGLFVANLFVDDLEVCVGLDAFAFWTLFFVFFALLMFVRSWRFAEWK
jgi:hypothetical protein